jgi:type II restriction/modification system DNA methylase subunit YeeA
LRKLDTIECRDALLTRLETKKTYIESEWPRAEFIVGNPPFLGGKLLRRGLGDEIVDALFEVYQGRVPAEADLVCYWVVKAWEFFEAGSIKRAGLVTTNSIRGGANRKTLEPIAEASAIFEAWSDEPWIVEGAAVRVSLICFGDNSSHSNVLSGIDTGKIAADLTSTSMELVNSKALNSNQGLAFQGPVLVGNFTAPGALAREWLLEPLNPNGLPNSDVLRPLRNGRDINSRARELWVIDFYRRSQKEAALFAQPFEYVEREVKERRSSNKDSWRRDHWWLHGRTGDDFRSATLELRRYIAGSQVSKHRIWIWLHVRVQPHQTVIAIARDDDTTFGILHSRFHEAWSLRLGTSLEDRPRYTPTTTFETFPFPEGLTPNIPAADYAGDPRAIRG